jgi:Na+/proline symporter
MSVTISVLVGYLLVLVVLAIWSRSETHTLAGYYLAGKKLPFWVVAFSVNATGESGWLLLGLTGMGYAVGAQAYWVVVGEIIGVLLSWGLISRRLKRMGDDTDSITLPDVLAAKFDDRYHLIRTIAVAIILIMVTTYVTAQMVASGKALQGFIGMDYRAGVLLGAVIIIGYTFVGGYKAVSYTDVGRYLRRRWLERRQRRTQSSGPGAARDVFGGIDGYRRLDRHNQLCRYRPAVYGCAAALDPLHVRQ